MWLSISGTVISFQIAYAVRVDPQPPHPFDDKTAAVGDAALDLCDIFGDHPVSLLATQAVGSAELRGQYTVIFFEKRDKNDPAIGVLVNECPELWDYQPLPGLQVIGNDSINHNFAGIVSIKCNIFRKKTDLCVPAILERPAKRYQVCQKYSFFPTDTNARAKNSASENLLRKSRQYLTCVNFCKRTAKARKYPGNLRSTPHFNIKPGAVRDPESNSGRQRNEKNDPKYEHIASKRCFSKKLLPPLQGKSPDKVT